MSTTPTTLPATSALSTDLLPLPESFSTVDSLETHVSLVWTINLCCFRFITSFVEDTDPTRCRLAFAAVVLTTPPTAMIRRILAAAREFKAAEAKIQIRSQKTALLEEGRDRKVLEAETKAASRLLQVLLVMEEYHVGQTPDQPPPKVSLRSTVEQALGTHSTPAFRDNFLSELAINKEEDMHRQSELYFAVHKSLREKFLDEKDLDWTWWRHSFKISDPIGIRIWEQLEELTGAQDAVRMMEVYRKLFVNQKIKKDWLRLRMLCALCVFSDLMEKFEEFYEQQLKKAEEIDNLPTPKLVGSPVSTIFSDDNDGARTPKKEQHNNTYRLDPRRFNRNFELGHRRHIPSTSPSEFALHELSRRAQKIYRRRFGHVAS